jgi:hypothetical protein
MTCPYCGRHVAQQLNTEGRPEVLLPDHMGICGACGGLSFLEAGQLRRITAKELKGLLAIPEYCAVVKRVLRGIWQAKHLRS